MSVASAIPEMLIQSGGGAYPVSFSKAVTDVVDAFRKTNNPVVIVDANVNDIYRTELSRLQGFPFHVISATEEEKTLAGIERVVTFLQNNRCNKQTTIIAIGGGIIQDVVTFASHIYYRGVPFVFVPTTLLSMSDSCIGAKCGINFGPFKNQLGVFHSPMAVLICPSFLASLADVDVTSGYGEILKLALTGSQRDYDALVGAVSASGFRNPSLLALIETSLRVKKDVIEKDEYELDVRRVLNYGHTFGHALEGVTSHRVPHGIAVAWGLDLANFIAWKKNLLPRYDFDRIHDFVAKHFATTCDCVLSASALIEGSRRDKKNLNGKLTMILLHRPGDLRVHQLDYDDWLHNTIVEFLSLNHAFFGN